MAEWQVVLSREEARMVDEIVGQDLESIAQGLNPEERQRRFRFLVKLDKALGKDDRHGGPFYELPPWIREILHRTFAPPQVAPKKKPAPAKPTPPAQVKSTAAKPKRALPKSAGLVIKAGTED